MNQRRFIVAAGLIDGSGGAVRRHVVLVVEEGVITAIGGVADLPRQVGAVIDDLSHCVLVPALVDCSVLLGHSPSVDPATRRAVAEADRSAQATLLATHGRYCHDHGVLGVVDSSGLLPAELAAVATDALLDIRTSAPLVRRGRDGSVNLAGGGDFVRIVFSEDIDGAETSSPCLRAAELAVLLNQRGGRKAVVVANGRQQVAEALAAGCDAIEQGYGMGEDNLRTMATNGVLWIPGLLRAKNALDGAASGGSVCCRFSQRSVAPGKPLPGAELFWQKTLAAQLAQLALARQWGVTTAVGTGAGSVGILHGEAMVEEIKLFIKAGYSLVETIRCATENGARFFGMAGLGALGVGKKASFLISRGTVQQLPRKLSYLEGIYINGAPSPAYHKNPGMKG